MLLWCERERVAHTWAKPGESGPRDLWLAFSRALSRHSLGLAELRHPTFELGQFMRSGGPACRCRRGARGFQSGCQRSRAVCDASLVTAMAPDRSCWLFSNGCLPNGYVAQDELRLRDLR